ncbi:DUF4817 domain-containing protein [Trichonephila clavipes]|nr:DUF4817 domain-containing protein [Trichonephila clavipes]
MVKVSDHDRHVMSSSTIPPKTLHREKILGVARASHLSSPSTNLTRGLAARRLFRVQHPCLRDSNPGPAATQSASLITIKELWFQQDGATCHTARAIIDLLKDTFGDRLISRFGPVNWPPRSCDLTPLDYFLWGYVKSLVYADKPQTLDHLEDNIRRVIADIRPQMLEKVIENWTSRLDYIRASRGSPMPEIIFKIVWLLLTVDYGMFGAIQHAYGGGLLFFMDMVVDLRARRLGVGRVPCFGGVKRRTMN